MASRHSSRGLVSVARLSRDERRGAQTRRRIRGKIIGWKEYSHGMLAAEALRQNKWGSLIATVFLLLIDLLSDAQQTESTKKQILFRDCRIFIETTSQYFENNTLSLSWPLVHRAVFNDRGWRVRLYPGHRVHPCQVDEHWKTRW